MNTFSHSIYGSLQNTVDSSCTSTNNNPHLPTPIHRTFPLRCRGLNIGIQCWILCARHLGTYLRLSNKQMCYMNKNTNFQQKSQHHQMKHTWKKFLLWLFLLLTIHLISRSMALHQYCQKLLLLKATGRVLGSKEWGHKAERARCVGGWYLLPHESISVLEDLGTKGLLK